MLTFSNGGFIQCIVGFPQPKLVSFLAADALSQLFKNFMLLGIPIEEAVERSFLDADTLALCPPALIQDDGAKVLTFGGNPRFPFGIRPPPCIGCSSSSNWTLITSNAKTNGKFKAYLVFACEQCRVRGLTPKVWSIQKPDQWIEAKHMPSDCNAYWRPFPAADPSGKQEPLKAAARGPQGNVRPRAG